MGDRAGAVAAVSCAAAAEGRGTAGGAGSWLRGEFTEVSPVNGFLYSVSGVMTSTAVGLKPAGVAGALAAAAAGVGRLPRARPDPRVAPNEPNVAGGLTGAEAAGDAWAASAGAGAAAGKSAGA